MGTLVGHVAPGMGFLLIGLWHLFNHIKLHSLNPNTYTSPPWFPSPILSKYLELLLIMAASAASVSMELFIGPDRHQPFAPDGSIPSNHLQNFEHSSISLTFFLYAAFSIILDRAESEAKHGLTQLLGSIAFAQQLLLFHLHSADHMGPEGQYHCLLQSVVFVSLSTTLLGIGCSRSFLVSFVRSASILFQGLWLVAMGFLLWTPGLVPKGCFMNPEDGHKVVRCRDDESLHRAINLVNILFSWLFVTVAAFAVSLYLVLVKFYNEPNTNDKSVHFSLGSEEEEDLDSPNSFLHAEKTYLPFDIER